MIDCSLETVGSVEIVCGCSMPMEDTGKKIEGLIIFGCPECGNEFLGRYLKKGEYYEV